VETALALLAIGVGLVALFGLGRVALESSREAENDRRCAVMADAVFETLRAVNAVYIDEARTNAYQLPLLWNELWNEQVQLQKPPPALWGTFKGEEGEEGWALLFPPVAGMCTNNIPLIYWKEGVNWAKMDLASAYHRYNISLANWNPLYHLNIHDLTDYRPSSVTGTHNAKQVTLIIYPDGNVGSSDPRIFTTILSNTGGMQ